MGMSLSGSPGEYTRGMDADGKHGDEAKRHGKLFEFTHTVLHILIHVYHSTTTATKDLSFSLYSHPHKNGENLSVPSV